MRRMRCAMSFFEGDEMRGRRETAGHDRICGLVGSIGANYLILLFSNT